MDDAGQSGMEGKVVLLERDTSQRGTVLPHFRMVVFILCGILKQVADRQKLIARSVMPKEDRALAEVGAELQQITGNREAILPFQEPREERLILRKELARNVIQRRQADHLHRGSPLTCLSPSPSALDTV